MKLHPPKRNRSVLIAFLICFGAGVALIVGGVSASRKQNRRSGRFYFKPAHVTSDSGTGPKIWLGDSQRVPARYAGDADAKASLETGRAQPLSLGSADFNADGMQDLVVGYATGEGGVLAIHRGNLDAFAPQSKESFNAIGHGDFPSPFLPDAKVISVPVHPDFVTVGTYNGYGFPDVLFAARGDHNLYLLSNEDGKGNFSPAKVIDVGVAITSLAAGEFAKSGTYSKLLVGVCDQNGPGLQVYSGARNALGSVTTIQLH